MDILYVYIYTGNVFVCMYMMFFCTCEHEKERKREWLRERKRERERQLNLNGSLPASCTKVWPQPPTTFPKIAAVALPKQLNKSGQRSRSRRRSTERQAIQFKHLHWHIDSYLNTATAWEATRGNKKYVIFFSPVNTFAIKKHRRIHF